MVNVLVVGSGGREHALSWKLSQSDLVNKVFVAPGNGGTSENIQISVDDIDALANFAQEKSCFTVVGPEAPLANGLVDKFTEKGLSVFGPSKQAAQLESSKIWAKEFMKRNDIPTADFEIFGLPNSELAKYIIENLDFDQLILEYHNPEEPNSGWIHCSYKNTEDNRKQVLRAYRDDAGKTIYEPYDPS